MGVAELMSSVWNDGVCDGMRRGTMIVLDFGGLALRAELRGTPTARALAELLPIEAKVSTWGRELFFPARAEVELEADAREVVSAGELAFWPEGGYIAIGFGTTPASQGDEIRLAAPVNVFADTADDVTRLETVGMGAPVRMYRQD